MARTWSRRSDSYVSSRRSPREPAQHHGDLPGKVQGVPDAAVVPLTLPHRHQVGSVPDEEHPAGPEALGHPGVMGVDPSPDDVHLGRGRDDRLQQAADELVGHGHGFGLAPLEHELEATDAVRNADGDVRPARVGTHPGARLAERVVADVDHEPVRAGRATLEGQAQRLAGEAAASVSTDHIGRSHAALTLRGDDGQLHAVGVLLERGDFGRPVHADGVEPGQPVQQHAVGQRLDETVAPGPAELGCGWRQPGEVAVLGVGEDEQLVGNGVRQHGLDQAGRLERPQRLVVHADAARVINERGSGFEDGDANPVDAEEVGEHQARGPRPDHSHVVVVAGSG